MRWSLLLLLFLTQDAGLAERLRKGGWAAVDELAAKSGTKAGLEALAAGKDAELAWWAGAALAEFEARAAWAPPLRITLEAKERGAGEILRELQAQAKGRGLDLPEGDRAVTVSFRDTPYLEAVDEVCRRAGFVLARGAGGRIQAVTGDAPRGPTFHRGGFAVTAASLVRRTDVTFREEPASQLQLTLLLRAEPAQRILDTDAACVMIRAEDDTGRSLLGGDARPSVRMRPPGENGATALFSLAVPAEGARKIALLRGTVTLTLARKVEELVFDTVMKAGGQVRESGGIKVSLAKIERDEQEVRLELELSSKERIPWPDSEHVSLEDAEGRSYARWGSSVNTSGTTATCRFTYRDREGLGAPEKLRVPVVTESGLRTLHFELKDLVLR